MKIHKNATLIKNSTLIKVYKMIHIKNVAFIKVYKLSGRISTVPTRVSYKNMLGQHIIKA